jgi:hypothetical protein
MQFSPHQLQGDAYARASSPYQNSNWSAAIYQEEQLQRMEQLLDRPEAKERLEHQMEAVHIMGKITRLSIPLWRIQD